MNRVRRELVGHEKASALITVELAAAPDIGSVEDDRVEAAVNCQGYLVIVVGGAHIETDRRQGAVGVDHRERIVAVFHGLKTRRVAGRLRVAAAGAGGGDYISTRNQETGRSRRV